MSELIEKVRGIIETHIAACEPPDAIARAAIAAVAEWMNEEFSYQAEMIEIRHALRAAAG